MEHIRCRVQLLGVLLWEASVQELPVTGTNVQRLTRWLETYNHETDVWMHGLLVLMEARLAPELLMQFDLCTRTRTTLHEQVQAFVTFHDPQVPQDRAFLAQIGYLKEFVAILEKERASAVSRAMTIIRPVHTLEAYQVMERILALYESLREKQGDEIVTEAPLSPRLLTGMGRWKRQPFGLAALVHQTWCKSLERPGSRSLGALAVPLSAETQLYEVFFALAAQKDAAVDVDQHFPLFVRCCNTKLIHACSSYEGSTRRSPPPSWIAHQICEALSQHPDCPLQGKEDLEAETRRRYDALVLKTSPRARKRAWSRAATPARLELVQQQQQQGQQEMVSTTRNVQARYRISVGYEHRSGSSGSSSSTASCGTASLKSSTTGSSVGGPLHASQSSDEMLLLSKATLLQSPTPSSCSSSSSSPLRVGTSTGCCILSSKRGQRHRRHSST